jgi:uncharacterized protein (TIGR03437 family)
MISSSGIISTVAGAGPHNGTVDNGPELPALDLFLERPQGVVVDSAGNLLVVAGGQVFRISPKGLANRWVTPCGCDAAGFSGDNGPAALALLEGGGGVALDPTGNLFIGDSGNYRVREVIGASSPPTITVSATQLTFVSDGVSNPAAQTITVNNTGAGMISWNMAVSPGASWLNLNPSSGLAPAAVAPGATSVTVSVGTAGLPAGTYSASISISSPSVAKSLVIPVVLSLGVTGVTMVENSATGQVDSSTYGVAPNSFLSIYSSNIGTAANPNLFPATNFQGLQVLFNGKAAPLYAVTPSANQINLVVPSELPNSGTATINVQNSTGLSQNITLTLAQDSVGVFRIPDSAHPNNGAVVFGGTTWLVMPTSTAAFYNFQTCTGKPAISSCAQPAKPGDNIVIYFTGGGLATPNGDPSGQPVPTGSVAPISGNPLYKTVENPIVTIGGIKATVQFSGIAPGTAAEYQLNTQIPLGVQPGDSVAVVFTFANSSDIVTIAIQSL